MSIYTTLVKIMRYPWLLLLALASLDFTSFKGRSTRNVGASSISSRKRYDPCDAEIAFINFEPFRTLAHSQAQAHSCALQVPVPVRPAQGADRYSLSSSSTANNVPAHESFMAKVWKVAGPSDESPLDTCLLTFLRAAFGYLHYSDAFLLDLTDRICNLLLNFHDDGSEVAQQTTSLLFSRLAILVRAGPSNLFTHCLATLLSAIDAADISISMLQAQCLLSEFLQLIPTPIFPGPQLERAVQKYRILLGSSATLTRALVDVFDSPVLLKQFEKVPHAYSLLRLLPLGASVLFAHESVPSNLFIQCFRDRAKADSVPKLQVVQDYALFFAYETILSFAIALDSHPSAHDQIRKIRMVVYDAVFGDLDLEAIQERMAFAMLCGSFGLMEVYFRCCGINRFVLSPEFFLKFKRNCCEFRVLSCNAGATRLTTADHVYPKTAYRGLFSGLAIIIAYSDIDHNTFSTAIAPFLASKMLRHVKRVQNDLVFVLMATTCVPWDYCISPTLFQPTMEVASFLQNKQPRLVCLSVIAQIFAARQCGIPFYASECMNKPENIENWTMMLEWIATFPAIAETLHSHDSAKSNRENQQATATLRKNSPPQEEHYEPRKKIKS